MLDRFDRRVISQPFIDLVEQCQRVAPCHLGGGAALSGAILAHRVTRDVDLFCHSPEHFEALRQNLKALGTRVGIQVQPVRSAPTFARFLATTDSGERIEVDLVDERVADIEPHGSRIEGIVIESLADLRANKLTCLLSRSEPRDLVDLLFLDRLGFPPEKDLPLALQKDAGMDPAVLAWLLEDFPCTPLPRMLVELTVPELQTFRDALSKRFRRLIVPPG